jgi:hypothetical protein
MRMTAACFCLLLSASLAAGQGSDVEYYDKGQALVTLSPVQRTNGFLVALKGRSAYPNLLLQVSKTSGASAAGSQARKYLVNTLSNRFDCAILMKDGPGAYRFTLFGSPSASRGSVSYSGLCYFSVAVRSNVPASFDGLDLGPRVAAEAERYLKRRVGRGECWDLAQQILDDLGADWQRPARFGRPVDWSKEEVRPGDIMQMYSVKLVYENRTEYFGLPQHTAVVSKVLAPGVYELLHQNVAGKRFVTRGQFSLKNMTAGTLEVYRPVAGILYPRR